MMGMGVRVTWYRLHTIYPLTNVRIFFDVYIHYTTLSVDYDYLWCSCLSVTRSSIVDCHLVSMNSDFCGLTDAMRASAIL